MITGATDDSYMSDSPQLEYRWTEHQVDSAGRAAKARDEIEAMDCHTTT